MNSAKELFAAACAAEDAGRIEQARELWQECVAMEPLNGRAWFCFGRFLHNQGEWQAAVDALTQVVRCESVKLGVIAKTWTCIGLCHQELKESQAAERAFRRSLELETNANVYVLLASLLWRNDQDDEAIETVQKAIHLDPTHDEAHYNLGCYYLLKDDFEAAEKYFRLAIELGYEEACAYDQLGQVLGRAKRQDKTEEKQMLEKAVALGSVDPWTRLYLANLCWQLEELDEAETNYQATLDLVEQGRLEGLACWTYGDFLSDTGRDLDRAEQLLYRAVELEADDEVAHYHLGLHLERDYRYNEAHTAFEESARLGYRKAQEWLDEMDEE